MRRLLLLVVAVAAVMVTAESSANAQVFRNGYQYGAGVGAFFGGGAFRRGFAREQPPFFAQFPPVYYSHIVKRPYGVSPFAVPGGIPPIELEVAVPVEPATISNPYFNQPSRTVKTPPVPTEVKPKAKEAVKTTWLINPYVGGLVKK